MESKEKYPTVTPKDVLQYKAATDKFLCSIEANIYGLEFGKFILRDMDVNQVLYSVEPVEGAPAMVDDSSRLIEYVFPKSFLYRKNISTTVEFKVGANEVKNFRMIERHYFRGKLLKSFDFTFGFCIPYSLNTWEQIYSLPELSEELVNEMVKYPNETKSDSFYFVEIGRASCRERVSSPV